MTSRFYPTLRGLLGIAQRQGLKIIVFACILLAYTLRYFITWHADAHPGGDGFYTWIFAHSLAVDGDLELGNDYAVCGDPWQNGIDQGGGRPANPFYFGPALIWAPLLRIAFAVVHLPPDASALWRNGCTGPLVRFVGASSPLVTTLVVWFGYCIARRWFRERVALTAAVIVAFASILAVFGQIWWPYAHVWAAAALTCAVLAWVRARERPESLPRWFVAGAAFGVAAVMRPQHAVWLLAPGLTLLFRIQRAVGRRAPVVRDVMAGAVTLAGFFSFFWIQLAVWKHLYGRIFVVPQGRLYVQPAHAHPFLLLFSARSGLFYYTPLMWLGLIGFVALATQRRWRPFGIELVTPLILDFYICSSPLAWTGGGTVGPRLLTSFCGIAILPVALSLDAIFSWLSRKRGRLAVAAATGWLAPMVILGWNTTNGNGPFSPVGIYVDSFRRTWADVDATIGNPFTLPATAVFSMRYGVPPNVFDRLARDSMFEHNYKNAELVGPDAFSLNAPPPEVYLAEGAPRPGGVLVAPGQRARILCSLGWPFVTHLRIAATLVSPPGSATVSLKTRTFFGVTRAATGELGGNSTEFEVAVPNDMFDSGINEVVIESSSPVVIQGWRWVDRTHHESGLR